MTIFFCGRGGRYENERLNKGEEGEEGEEQNRMEAHFSLRLQDRVTVVDTNDFAVKMIIICI